MFPYSFNISEPGIHAELYIPKRSKLQGDLYDVLTKGFDLAVVQAHLLDTSKSDGIRQMLAAYTSLHGYTEERVRKMEKVFWGYSMYEVDGVFCSADCNNPAVIEERTQIIRLMFRPDLRGYMSREGIPLAEYRSIRNAAGSYLRVVDRLAVTEAEELKSPIIGYLRKWRDDAALFLFGYVVFHLCTCLKQYHDLGELGLEEEIWVCSIWNLEINRVNLDEAYTVLS